MKLIFYILILLLFVSTVSAIQQSISKNNFVITSDRDTYYCQNIYSKDGCLFKGNIEITNNDNKNHNIDLGIDSSVDIKIKKHKDMDKRKSKSIKTNEKTLIKKGETITVPFEFYSNENGKFDYYIDTGTFEVRLDPVINISINVTPPNYHLINGTAITDNINLFQNITDISSGLHDNSESSSYHTTYALPSLYKLIDGFPFNHLDMSSIVSLTVSNSNTSLIFQ